MVSMAQWVGQNGSEALGTGFNLSIYLKIIFKSIVQIQIMEIVFYSVL